MSDFNAHSGHRGQSGIQNHSCGPHFPVRSYCIGSSDHRVAEFCGVRRDSFNRDDHADDLDRMKLAEVIADKVCADPDGGSHFLDRPDAPDSGYCVGLAGLETRIKLEGKWYPAAYADIVGKLEWIAKIGWGNRPICIGWWTREGITYFDISVVCFDRAEALAYAERNDQIAIYDLANQCDIDIRYA